MLTLSITKQSNHQEWKITLTIAHSNGFPINTIHDLEKKTDNQKSKTKTETPNHSNTTKQEMGNIYLSQSTNKKGY